MNRTAILEVGMLTQCYDNRTLHRISPTDEARASALADAVQASTSGATVVAGQADVHMRWVDPWGRVTTLGEYLGVVCPLVVIRCREERARV